MVETDTIWPLHEGGKVTLSNDCQGHSNLGSEPGYIKELFSFFGLGLAIVHFPRSNRYLECPVKELKPLEK
jgi:hypothetical protein